MPELPEIEALATFLTVNTRGQAIEAVRLRSFAALKTFDPPLESLVGKVAGSWSRQGKFLLLDTSGTWLGVHLGRAGWIRWRESSALTAMKPGRSPVAVQFRLADGRGFDITEQGTEKRLALHVVHDPSEIPGVARLGPDPFDPALDDAALHAHLQQHPGHLKSLLVDQKVLAGIGNAYSDEILHAARLSPFRRASALSVAETSALRQAMLAVLRAAVTRAADLPAADVKSEKRSHMAVHGRTGEPCPDCGAAICEVSLSTRSFQYCPGCQTGGRRLSDRRMSRLLR